jgi:hypothetical protein
MTRAKSWLSEWRPAGIMAQAGSSLQGQNVTKIALFAVLLAAAPATAQSPADYTITVHVSSSRWAIVPGNLATASVQLLDVVIDGKKYDLEANAPSNSPSVLALGDYKAKLVQDEHKTAYESSETYELLFPDKKTRKFMVVGQTE